jgi:hypothetical protein
MIDMCPLCEAKGLQLRVAAHRSSKIKSTDNTTSATTGSSASTSATASAIEGKEAKEIKSVEIEVIVDIGGHDSGRRLFTSPLGPGGEYYAPVAPPKKKSVVKVTAESNDRNKNGYPDGNEVETASASTARAPSAKRVHKEVSMPSDDPEEQNITEESNEVPKKSSRHVCPHGRQKSRCRDCGGAAFCQHGRIRYDCRDCSRKLSAVPYLAAQ